jgi:hypothetical protein
MRWAGHVAGIIQKVAVRKPEGKGPFEIEDNIKLGVDWIQLDQYRGKWCPLVDTDMNLLVSQKVINLLAS